MSAIVEHAIDERNAAARQNGLGLRRVFQDASRKKLLRQHPDARFRMRFLDRPRAGLRMRHDNGGENVAGGQ